MEGSAIWQETYVCWRTLLTVTRDDEDVPRHHYKGRLLARVTPGMIISIQKDIPGYLKRKTEQLTNSRIVVNSGGPIGYLGVDG